MGDLETDTTVTSLGDGRHAAKLSDDWAIWGPNGGYVASVPLRAAGAATGRARPVSIVAHFLSVATFDEVELTVTELRSSRYATSVRVAMRQGDRPILEALVWGVDSGGPELVHEVPTMPDVPPPEQVPTFEERMALVDEPPDRPPFRFWDNLEHRPLQWRDTWPPPGPGEPEGRWWFRFRPTPVFDDPWVDACRLLVPIDTMGWPAAVQPHAHIDPLPVIAPSIDLSARFHRPAAGAGWLLCEAVSPVAAGGLMAAT
ncbi:MAG: acyl-CoA thioesterase, partial [Acidimicrobiales bacterium]